MRTNKTKDQLTWMQKMRMSYNGVSQQVDAWVQGLLNTSKRQYGKYTVFGIILEAFKQLSTLIFTQIVVGTREHNILTAEQTASIRGLAQLACYKTVSACESTGKISIEFAANAATELSPTVYIKNHATFRCKENNLIYSICMSEDFQQCILNDTSISRRYEFVCKQGEYASQQFVTNNVPLETFVISERNDFVSEDSIVVTVNDKVWTKYMSFAEMDRYSNGYVISWSFDGKLQLMFGNGVTGVMPDINSVVNVTYLKCAGYDGNLLVQNDATFEWQDGMFDSGMNSINPKASITFEQVTNIVGGYNGDDIETIRNNAGAINRSLVLHSAESIAVYMSRFGQYKVIDIWSNTESQIIHVIAVPNILDKFIKAGTLVYNYWSLPLNEFTLSSTDISYLQAQIKAIKDYVLLTEIKFETVKLIYFQCYILCRKKYTLQNAADIKQSVMSIVTEHIQDNWADNKQFISRSALIKVIEQLDLLETVDVKFDSETESNLQFIDNLGNINVTDKNLMPLVRSTEGTDVSLSIKVLVENETGTYIEA